MRRALKERLAAYKIPQEMKVVEAVPRNAMGKGECSGSVARFSPRGGGMGGKGEGGRGKGGWGGFVGNEC